MLDYIDGITIIDTSGIVRFSIKFDPCWNKKTNKQIIGKKLLDVFSELDSKTSTLFQCMEQGIPVSYSRQRLNNDYSGKAEIEGISYPIKINGNIAGAVEISKERRKSSNQPGEETDIKEMLQRINVDFSNRARYSLDDIVCKNETMKEHIKYAKAIAKSISPVLILGETGTGKELFAHGIHAFSDRKDRPFIVQNCSAIPESLLEGILFGTCKGSFTGALDRKGIFEIADGGTLFLDEIHTMSLQIQAKLLRVIQDGFVRRVGAENEKKVDVRIIAAANVDYNSLLKDSAVRKDLLYRLSVLVIQIPALRQRKEDIEVLIEYFIKKYNALLSKSVVGIKKEVREVVVNSDWPGNVRELENMVEASMNIVSCNDEYIEYKDLPTQYKSVTTRLSPIALKETLEEMEQDIIKKSLAYYKWNVSETAKALQLPRQTLQQKMKKYDIRKVP